MRAATQAGLAIAIAPEAPGEPAWPTFAPRRSYMHFTTRPEVATDLMPGMYELNEEVMERRRRAGNQQWRDDVGVAAPVLPPAAANN